MAVTPDRKPAGKRTQSDSKVHLLHADHLYFDEHIHRTAQILVGDVRFRHEGVLMYCDSALYYEDSNSFDAFGHVRMNQGDTLHLNSEVLYYNGLDRLARARYDVVLKHGTMTIYTDSLDYDRLYELGYFFEGGKTGLTALTTGILFLACIFIAPVAAIIPTAATSAALIYVGILMIIGLKNIDWGKIDQAVPAGILMIGMPISGSIGHAIGLSLISYTVIKLVTGKAREVSVLTYVLSVIFLVKFFVAV